jgi:hypothetical protein
LGILFEIHKYQQNDFEYVVAGNNKHSENKVKDHVELTYGTLLNESLKAIGAR